VLHFSDILKTKAAPDLTLGRNGRVLCEPGWQLGHEWSANLKDFDLWFVWQGRGRLVREQIEVELRSGTCLWLAPGNEYQFTQDPHNRLGVTFIHFSLAKKTRFPTPPFEALDTRHFEFVNSSMRKVVDLMGEGDRALATNLFFTILQQLVNEHRSLRSGLANGTTRHHLEVVHDAVRRIRERPGEIESVAQLARQAGYSADHFSRIFQRVIGRTPQQYVIDAKMDRARLLLADSRFTVGEVATALGYDNLHFFSRQFLQQNGVPPTAFRRKAGAKAET
jgi:AraC-like DNA-binding protein